MKESSSLKVDYVLKALWTILLSVILMFARDVSNRLRVVEYNQACIMTCLGMTDLNAKVGTQSGVYGPP